MQPFTYLLFNLHSFIQCWTLTDICFISTLSLLNITKFYTGVKSPSNIIIALFPYFKHIKTNIRKCSNILNFFFLVSNLNLPLLHPIYYINPLINFISSLNILPQQNKNKIFSFSLKKYVGVYSRVGSTLKTASPTRCTLTHWTTLYNKLLK